MVGVAKRYNTRVHAQSLAVQEQLGHLSTRVQENLAGSAVVRAYTMEPAQVAAFRRDNAEQRARVVRLARTQGTFSPIMGLMGAGLVALGRSGSRIAMTNHGPREGVGSCNAGRPAGADRCKYLHRQRKQDYGEKILEPPSHRNTHPSPLNHRQSPESRSGSLHYLAGAAKYPLRLR